MAVDQLDRLAVAWRILQRIVNQQLPAMTNRVRVARGKISPPDSGANPGR